MTEEPDDRETIEKIRKLKEALGERLIILTHHYQRKEIVDLGDFKGDSFGLSQRAAADKDAQYIVFCGVHFMAESAEILSQPHQTVQIPAIEAGCPMADMADSVLVERAWEALDQVVGAAKITPMVYMNSDAELKAFCGKNSGLVCTSSNAPVAFDWAYSQREKILFFPDQHLGRNTGNQKGFKPEEMIVWDPEKELGGNSPDAIKKATLILWDGYCHVHTRFSVAHILSMRERFPDAKVVVHPECPESVVQQADAAGSTSFIVNYVKEAEPGSVIIIGTEINLIDRLAREYPDRKVLDLHNSLCPNMFKINLRNLLWTLENIGKVNVIEVPDHVKADARKALDRMLALASA
ncbi:MAG: quinolinate synthase NadA [Deltaproteobacteria bacterium]|nr:quinolinate synthase NadA [Deltaproteobacteria bacterium]